MDNEQMPLTSHLGELRRRLITSLVVIFLFLMGTFSFSEELISLLATPMQKQIVFTWHLPFITYHPVKSSAELVFLAPAEAFWMNFKVALITAVILSLPILLAQVWLFIKPALRQEEKKYLVPFVVCGTMLFLIGALFCFLIVLPFGVNFLLNYKTGSLRAMISIGNYMDFTMKFILAFGVIFELPIILVFLTKMGLVTPAKLAHFRKYAIVLAFVVAGILTPTPDAFNQILMAGPIILLYEAGIMASKLFYRKKKDETALPVKTPEADS